eukprot:Cvel_21714.t2-p1 / transcript=Cvel_21714.t2 / gene=Cvel_21714 / organism=Chromera_velia_CCMP2878 / gene_product=Ankyrin repeat and SOCS box protein 3, putative / transcript_product=Ankyrin repeat and SOCS box protein 3, putative / location=Cvel_scaffold2060:26998-27564(-) / protein_length=151 / sequence_SO=supercontig / SO=protein_coding / is_pseudo=false
MVEALASMSADLSAKSTRNDLPAHKAAWNGHSGTLRLLHSLGANVTGESGKPWRPAIQAAVQGHVEVLRTLHELGADLASPGKDIWSPAQHAANRGQLLALKFLYDIKAVDVKTVLDMERHGLAKSECLEFLKEAQRKPDRFVDDAPPQLQ